MVIFHSYVKLPEGTSHIMSITNQGPPWWKVLVGCRVPNVDAVLTADVEGHDVALKDFQRETTNNDVNQYIDMMMHLYFTNMYICIYIYT